MAFLLNSQAQGVSGKNEQSTQTRWRRAPTPEARGRITILMQLHRLKLRPALGMKMRLLSFFVIFTQLQRTCLLVVLTVKKFCLAVQGRFC